MLSLKPRHTTIPPVPAKLSRRAQPGVVPRLQEGNPSFVVMVAAFVFSRVLFSDKVSLQYVTSHCYHSGRVSCNESALNVQVLHKDKHVTRFAEENYSYDSELYQRTIILIKPTIF